MARISFYGDDRQLHEVAVGPDTDAVTVGRHSACPVRTAGQSVSRRHARIYWLEGRYLLEDLGSSNGTFYRKHRLEGDEKVVLADGEIFMCGTFELRLDFEAADHEPWVAPAPVPPPPPPGMMPPPPGMMPPPPPPPGMMPPPPPPGMMPPPPPPPPDMMPPPPPGMMPPPPPPPPPGMMPPPPPPPVNPPQEAGALTADLYGNHEIAPAEAPVAVDDSTDPELEAMEDPGASASVVASAPAVETELVAVARDAEPPVEPTELIPTGGPQSAAVAPPEEEVIAADLSLYDEFEPLVDTDAPTEDFRSDPPAEDTTNELADDLAAVDVQEDPAASETSESGETPSFPERSQPDTTDKVEIDALEGQVASLQQALAETFADLAARDEAITLRDEQVAAATARAEALEAAAAEAEAEAGDRAAAGAANDRQLQTAIDDRDRTQERLVETEEILEDARAGRRAAEEVQTLIQAQADMKHQQNEAQLAAVTTRLAATEAQLVAAKTAAAQVTELGSELKASRASVATLTATAAARDVEAGAAVQVLQTRLDDAERAQTTAQADLATLQQASEADATAQTAENTALRAQLTGAQGAQAAAEREIDALKEAYQQRDGAAEADRDGLRAELDAARTAQADLAAQVAALNKASEAEVRANAEELASKVAQLEASQATLAALETEITALKATATELRAVLTSAEVAASQLDDAHAARDAAEAEAKRYRRELRRASEEVERLEVKLEGAATPVSPSPDLSALSEIVAELYGAVSSFRPDLRSLSDGVELAASDDAEERGDGVELLRDTLDAVNGRARDLKTLTRDLRKLVE